MSQAMYRYPSMTSVHSMASMGHLPPGHGYIPRKQKPDKPYGPSFVTIMNRTWRGPGKTYLMYALVACCVSLTFYGAAGLYFGHRNVSRMIVLRTEVWGAIFIIIGILTTGLMFHFIWLARMASNDWRRYTRFRPEGLYTAAAYNHAYVPEDGMKLATGTYGPRALKEIPRPKAKGRSRRGSQSSQRNAPPASATSTAERRYEKKEEAEASKGYQEAAKPYSGAPSAQGSMEYLAAEPRALGYAPPPTEAHSQPQEMTSYAAQPYATAPPASAFSVPQVTTHAQPSAPQGYGPAPSYSQSQGVGYQPPAGPDEPLTPKTLGYQPPPGPDEPSLLYAKPRKGQHRPQSGYPDSHVSVPAFSPMPASPTGQVAARYSMEEMQQPRTAAHLSLYGMQPANQSESEL